MLVYTLTYADICAFFSTKLCDLTSWQQGACQTKIPMTYEVTWHNTSTPFSQRFQRYLDQDFFEHEVYTSAYVRRRQKSSAYVSIRQHTSAYVSIRKKSRLLRTRGLCVCVCVFMYLCRHIRMYVCMYVCIYAYY